MVVVFTVLAVLCLLSGDLGWAIVFGLIAYFCSRR